MAVLAGSTGKAARRTGQLRHPGPIHRCSGEHRAAYSQDSTGLRVLVP